MIVFIQYKVGFVLLLVAAGGLTIANVLGDVDLLLETARTRPRVKRGGGSAAPCDRIDTAEPSNRRRPGSGLFGVPVYGSGPTTATGDVYPSVHFVLYEHPFLGGQHWSGSVKELTWSTGTSDGDCLKLPSYMHNHVGSLEILMGECLRIYKGSSKCVLPRENHNGVDNGEKGETGLPESDKLTGANMVPVDMGGSEWPTQSDGPPVWWTLADYTAPSAPIANRSHLEIRMTTTSRLPVDYFDGSDIYVGPCPRPYEDFSSPTSDGDIDGEQEKGIDDRTTATATDRSANIHRPEEVIVSPSRGRGRFLYAHRVRHLHAAGQLIPPF